MRNVARRRSHEEEEESVFVSMTDVTVSFLFIVILLLAFFASQYTEEEAVPKSTYDAVVVQRDDLQADLAEREAQVTALQAQLAATEADLVTRTTEVNELQIQVADLERQLAAVREELARRDADIATLTALLAERVAEIEHLGTRLAEQQTEIAALQAEAETLRARITELDAEVAELQAALAAAQRDPLEQYLQQAAARREILLQQIAARLQEIPGIQITVSSDALSISGERGLFNVGVPTIRSDGLAIVDTVARALNELLPCFTLGAQAAWNQQCNPSAAVVDAVQIEGHTDNQGDLIRNLELSTARANETFKRMIGQVGGLLDHLNLEERPVLSVAGYGQWRPIADNASVEGRARNRRIDLRIIMYTPNGVDDLERVAQELRNAAE